MHIYKRSNQHILAHLYEHLYFIYIDTSLRSAGLYSTVDYSLDATTSDGLIHFEIETYSSFNLPKHLDTADHNLSFTSHQFEIALLQIEAEYRQSLIFNTETELTAELAKIKHSKWYSSPEEVRPIDNSLVIDTGSPLETTSTEVNLNYHNIEPSLKPLYRIIAGIILGLTTNDTVDSFGGYVTSQSYQTNRAGDLTATIESVTPIDPTSIEKLLKEVVYEFTKDNAHTRLARQLSNVDSMTSPPIPNNTLRDTGIAMTPEKWKEISTTANTLKLLSAIPSNLTISQHQNHTRRQ